MRVNVIILEDKLGKRFTEYRELEKAEKEIKIIKEYYDIQGTKGVKVYLTTGIYNKELQELDIDFENKKLKYKR